MKEWAGLVSLEAFLLGLQMTPFCMCMLPTCDPPFLLVPISSYEDTSPMGLGPHPMTLFNLNYLPKALSPYVITMGVTSSRCEFGGDRVQSRIVSECMTDWMKGELRNISP